jgi:hypothetical protein
MGIFLLISHPLEDKILAPDIVSAFGKGWDAGVEKLFSTISTEDILIYEDESAIFRDDAKYTEQIGRNFGLDTLQDREYSKKDLEEAYQNGFNNAIVFLFANAKSGLIYDSKNKSYTADYFLIATE